MDEEELGYEELVGGWRCLCAGVFLQAVQSVQGRARHSLFSNRSGMTNREKQQAIRDERLRAKAWLEGNHGLITVEDCCDSLGISVDRARMIVARLRNQ